ncbi:NUDIX hydrolase [Lysinibacillus sp. NPDC092081]|uniref:NUDIX hydrolase n=1 Tax=Lysinibacillus sp. NPDC092081 TaxID=3364131 RepID=UPI00382FCB62
MKLFLKLVSRIEDSFYGKTNMFDTLVGISRGHYEITETLKDVACRELHEETGLLANEITLIGIFSET